MNDEARKLLKDVSDLFRIASAAVDLDAALSILEKAEFLYDKALVEMSGEENSEDEYPTSGT